MADFGALRTPLGLLKILITVLITYVGKVPKTTFKYTYCKL